MEAKRPLVMQANRYSRPRQDAKGKWAFSSNSKLLGTPAEAAISRLFPRSRHEQEVDQRDAADPIPKLAIALIM